MSLHPQSLFYSKSLLSIGLLREIERQPFKPQLNPSDPQEAKGQRILEGRSLSQLEDHQNYAIHIDIMCEMSGI
jgi:hypothetical protein